MRTLALAAAVLAVSLVNVRADDDPEPPNNTGTGKLQGKWVSVRKITKGKESAYVNESTYTFKGDKVDYTYKAQAYTMKVELDRKRPFAMNLTKDKTPPRKYYYKLEKGELYLTLDRDNDPNAKPDFTVGTKSIIFIYKREK